jgi:hypothetical protein
VNGDAYSIEPKNGSPFITVLPFRGGAAMVRSDETAAFHVAIKGYCENDNQANDDLLDIR